MVDSIMQEILAQVRRIDTGCQIFTRKIRDLELRVESLEHYSNQQSILVDTLGSIMEELRKQEL